MAGEAKAQETRVASEAGLRPADRGDPRQRWAWVSAPRPAGAPWVGRHPSLLGAPGKTKMEQLTGIKVNQPKRMRAAQKGKARSRRW